MSRQRGVNEMSSVALDYLSATFSADLLSSVDRVLSPLFGDPNGDDSPGRWYKTRVAYGDGVTVFYSRTTDDTGFERPEAFVEIKGNGCERMSADESADLLRGLRAVGVKATRVDLRYDDCEKIISVEEIDDRHGETFRFGPYRYKHFHKGGTRESNGPTLDFGRHGKLGSGSMFVVYDKAKESAGKIDAIRYEARWFKEKAELVFEQLTGSSTPWDDAGDGFDAELLARRMGALIAGAITFYDDDGDRGSRRRVAAWWARVCERLGDESIRIRLPAPDPPEIEAVKREVAKACGQRLAAIRLWYENQDRALEFDRWLARVVDEGSQRLGPRLKAIAGERVAAPELIQKLREQLPF